MEEASGVIKVSALTIPTLIVFMLALKFIGFAGSSGPSQSTTFGSITGAFCSPSATKLLTDRFELIALPLSVDFWTGMPSCFSASVDPRIGGSETVAMVAGGAWFDEGNFLLTRTLSVLDNGTSVSNSPGQVDSR